MKIPEIHIFCYCRKRSYIVYPVLMHVIVKEAKEYTDKKMALVMGGYHLLPYKSGELNDLANRLKNDLDVVRVAPAHCTGHLAFKILKDVYKNNFLAAGLGSIITL